MNYQTYILLETVKCFLIQYLVIYIFSSLYYKTNVLHFFIHFKNILCLYSISICIIHHDF